MQKMIYLPDSEVKAVVKAAKAATETGGVGAYLVLLHKEESKRKARRDKDFHT